MNNTEVMVYISLGDEVVRVGTLWFYLRKNRESASFEYDREWLAHPDRFSLDPALVLGEGVFHTDSGARLFGAMGDSAPDRWGRLLMRRVEAARAKREKSTPRMLSEIDYLLGVSDEARQGALRFSMGSREGVFLAEKDAVSIPPLITLPHLLSATESFLADKETDEDLALLLAPGSSLGGARPKASVRDRDGGLAIAKFPSKTDDFSVVLWEAVALTLAQKAGITVPLWRLELVSSKPVLIIKRFDRRDGIRIPFLSAMSMLGARDNEPRSYLEIAYALVQHGADPDADMAELWRRIVFSIMISNTDDHLRNHGFLYEQKSGWRLSPAFDLNPTPRELKPRFLTTAIDFTDTLASLATARVVASEFRVTPERANEIIGEVAAAVRQWRHVATELGISRQECDRMVSAFVSEEE